MRRTLYRQLVALVVAICAAAPGLSAELFAAESKTPSPLSPDDALQQFAIHPDLRIELVAAEPEVVDPVAMAFDEYGRLWVVEMGDYPFGPQEGEPPKSRIKLLEDADDDGRYETAHTFADGLLFATGIQPWQGGVIVTLAGEIAWLADTNDDRQADVHETWFRGFAERNPQLRANDPTFWFDGHVYVAGGLHYGGKIVTVHEDWRGVNGREPIELGNRDFRFDPRTGRAEAIAGGAQFGLAFDAFGHRFVCSNSRPIEHVVLEDRHLTRNERAQLTQTNERVIAEREDRRLYPLSRQETTSYLHEGHFTAACGLLIYSGDALPDEFRGNAFICEPTASLVHREVLKPHGPSLTARAARDGVEFLASRDSWFQPVFLSEGPDGALYVVDMYRAVIEHPEWFPDLESRNDLTAGNDRGRIWRITRRDAEPPETRTDAPEWDETEHLVGLLGPRNAWHRRTAARLMVERAEPIDAAALRQLATSDASSEARATALQVLDGLGHLSADDVLAALDDEDAGVRRAALRLAEPRVGQSKPLHERVQQIAVGPRTEQGERFAALLSLGATPAGSLGAVLQLVVRVEADDPWMRVAMLSLPIALGPVDLDNLCRAIADNGGRLSDGQRALIGQVAEQVGRYGTDDEIGKVVNVAPTTTGEIARVRLAGLAKGVGRRGVSFRDWISGQPDALRRQWQRHLANATMVASDKAADVAIRRQAMDILEYGEFDQVIDTLQTLLVDATEPAIRTAAIRAVARFNRSEAAEILLARLARLPPSERRVALESLLAGSANTRSLVDQIERDLVPPAVIDAGTRQRLLSHPRDEIRRRAETIFAADASADREAVIAAYRAAVEPRGDVANGRAVFERHCASCHRVGGVGTAVGPDVADNYNKTREQLLVAILDPNRTIESRYEAYLVETKSGRTLQGLLANETVAAIAIEESEGKTTSIPREEIADIRPTGLSLMPSGVEQGIDVNAMTDLLSYLKGWRALRP